jgi:hypothetical protein
MLGKITFTPEGEAYAESGRGLRPLRGRFVTIGKRRDCLILSALKSEGCVRISLSAMAPNTDKVVSYPFDSPEWELTYVHGKPAAPSPMATLPRVKVTRCEHMRRTVGPDYTKPTVQCVKRSMHTGAHHYINRNFEPTKK